MWISKDEIQRIDALARELQLKIASIEAITDTFCKPSKSEGQLAFYSKEYLTGRVTSFGVDNRLREDDIVYLSHGDAIRMLAKHIGMEFTVEMGTPTQVVLEKIREGE